MQVCTKGFIQVLKYLKPIFSYFRCPCTVQFQSIRCLGQIFKTFEPPIIDRGRNLGSNLIYWPLCDAWLTNWLKLYSIASSGHQIWVLNGSCAWHLRLIVSAHVDWLIIIAFCHVKSLLQPLQSPSVLATSPVNPCLQTSYPKPSSDTAAMSHSRRLMSPRALPGMCFRLWYPCSLCSYRV